MTSFSLREGPRHYFGVLLIATSLSTEWASRVPANEKRRRLAGASSRVRLGRALAAALVAGLHARLATRGDEPDQQIRLRFSGASAERRFSSAARDDAFAVLLVLPFAAIAASFGSVG
jgi:hypothetical protein